LLFHWDIAITERTQYKHT